MNTETLRAASDLLVRHWQNGTVLDALPTGMRPNTREEGYAIQAQIEALSNQPLWGWKIAATSLAGQKHIGIDGPIAGRLLKEMVLQEEEVVPFGANRMRVAEAEFAFKMGRDLPPRASPYSRDEVMDAVADLYLGLEFPDSRYADFAEVGGPQLIADNACAHLFVIGPKAPDIWREIDLSEHRIVGKTSDWILREGIGSNVLGDPRIALTWLANELSAIGVTLSAGQSVTTGTCLVPMEIQQGDKVSADFGVLGQVHARLSDR